MGFRAITAAFQEQIDDHQQRPINQSMVDDIEEILEDYCCTLEKIYGISLSFDVEVSQEDNRLHYNVIPETDFDQTLLEYITHSEFRVPRITLRLQ